MLILFVLFFWVKTEKGCCIYKPEGESGTIDLTPLKGQFFTFPLTGYQGHEMTATFCDVLDKGHECVAPTTTYGPTPMKDEFSGTPSDSIPNNSCYYQGGLNNCTFSDWEPNSKTSILFYPGIPDQENQIRHIKWTVFCDNSVTEPKTSCSNVESIGNTHTYQCELRTPLGCPGIKPHPSELGCEVCKVFVSLLQHNAEKDKSTYVDLIKEYYCPIRKDPKECYDAVPSEIDAIIEEMKSEGESFCEELSFCKKN